MAEKPGTPPKRRGIGGLLVSLGMAEEVGGQTPSPPAAPMAPRISTVASTPPRAPAPTFTGTSEVDPRFQRFIDETLAELPDRTLAQFEEILAPLTAAIADEATRFRAIFEMAKARQILPAAILAAIDGATQALTRESDGFSQHIAQKAEEAVQTRRQEANVLEQRISELNGELTALQERIAGLKRELGDTNRGIEHESGKLTRSASQFAQVVQKKVTDLANLRTKVERYAPQQ